MINTNKATIIDERLDGQLVSTGFFCYQVVLGEIEYLKIIFDSHYFKKTKNSLCTGTTQKSINDENLSKILVPLAPLEEQRRIVELIHKLDSLIGKYSKFEIELSELEEELPTKLEKSIINYAMKGKLVKQDQNNDSVDNLINEIYKEKQKLVEQGKLKKADLNNLIIYKNDNDNSYYEKFENGREEKIEVPFEIPYNWIWSRFNKVVNFKIGKTPPTNDLSFWNGKIPWVSISDMIKNSKIKSTKKFISKKALSSYFNNNLVKKETLIMSFKLTVGKTSILGIDAVHNEGIISIYPYFDKNNLFRDFLMLFLPIFSQFGDKKEAIKGGTLNTKSLSKLLIPIPPLKEQQRIVENITKIQKLLKNL
ncbi:restriction endonuclease subunit S [Mycoplasmopsis bovis]|nr:restriction endonuclease subunit S [Mycoplasmopsis bovis]